MKITQYSINSQKIRGNITVACVSDLHGHPADKVISALASLSPDLIILAGDIFEVANRYMKKRNANAFKFIAEAVKIAPVYYCYGNHEIYYSHAIKEQNRIPEKNMQDEYMKKIIDIGITMVNDSFVEIKDSKENKLFIGGLVCGRDTDPDLNVPDFDKGFLEEYGNVDGFKMLICHYPHYYEKYLKNTDFDLIVSGHAHGGHWRIFGRGVYAPHQGLFPKYTAGIHDGRFIINTGAVNNTRPIPRFFNPTEIVKINILGSEETR